MPPTKRSPGGGRKPKYTEAKVRVSVRLPQPWIDELIAGFGGIQIAIESLVIDYFNGDREIPHPNKPDYHLLNPLDPDYHYKKFVMRFGDDEQVTPPQSPE